MLLVYCEKITPRVRYAFDLILRELLQVPYELTGDAEKFRAHNGPALEYAKRNEVNATFQAAAGLLFESGIHQISPEVGEHDGRKMLFKVHGESMLPYDPFAAAFFMVSRYEEYLPHKSDSHQRFAAADTLAFRNGFLDQPIVHHWANQVKSCLATAYPELTFGTSAYRFINTLDIDNAWAYREKGMIRTFGGLGRSIIKGKIKEFGQRIRVLLGRSKDPYDTYDFILEQHKERKLDTIIFFLLADYGMNDKNVPVSSRKFQSLIKYIADYTRVGIHPGYMSNTIHEQLEVEVGRLADITKREVTRSRQHFLRLNFPETYRRLVDQGITDDYTMGFASQTGFRSGMCIPYQHYDLDSESLTKLKIHPFAVMDGTLNEYLHLSPEQAIAKVEQLVNAVREVNGTFIHIWHNETLNDQGIWKGWKEVYLKTLDLAQ